MIKTSHRIQPPVHHPMVKCSFMHNMGQYVKKPCGITYYERQTIEFQLRGKWPIRRIARYLKWDHSVVVREIKRILYPEPTY